MKTILAIMALAMSVMASPVVNFTTSGTFSSTGTDHSSGGDIKYTVLLGGGSIDLGVVNPSNTSFGDLDTNTISPTLIDISDTFTLTIFQTGDLGSGTGSFTGAITGGVGATGSNAKITFATPTLTINGVAYTLQSEYDIVPPSTNAGVTSLQGTVGASTPEPATLAIVGLGLMAVGTFARRRIAQPAGSFRDIGGKQ